MLWLWPRYENELFIRQSVETDVAGLKLVRDDLTFANKDLKIRLSGLQEELLALNKSYEGVWLHLLYACFI